MRKVLTALVAVTVIGATTMAVSTPAAAWWRGDHWGWRGGWGWGPGPFVTGPIVGAATAAAPPYYYGPYGGAYTPYYAYAPNYIYPPVNYGCGRVFNGYYMVAACY